MPDRHPTPTRRWPLAPALAPRALQRLVWPMLLLLLLGLLGLAGNPARAGSLPGELPALVGRINVLAGTLQLQDRDSGQWQRAEGGLVSNWPLAGGDRLRLQGRDARADLRIGSTTLRLGAGAELWLQQLDEQAVVLQLQDGTLALRLAAIDGDGFGPVELRTREGRWLPRHPGHYRFDRERDATQASVWRGELQFEGADSALTIPERRRADLWLDNPDNGRRSATRYAWAPVQRDAFADWVARDERQDDAPVSARHVPPGMSGWQDLDRHGDWVSDNDHGPLWLPRVVAPGWAPYQVGRWAWVSPWGWTWIDAAPWGFAPSHYGSWLRFDERWAWSPGPRGPRVRYAPALSAWVGGPVVGINLLIGNPRPPPPRVVIPVVPVVVVVVRRDQPYRHPYPRPAPVVVAPRPGWQAGEPGHPGRWDDRRGDWRDHSRGDWRDDRRDDRRGDRRDDRRDDPRGDRRDDRRDGRDGGRAEYRPELRPMTPGLPALPVVPAVAVMPATPRPVDMPAIPAAPTAPVVTRPADAPHKTVPRPIARAPQPADQPAEPRAPRADREEGRRGEPRAERDATRDTTRDIPRDVPRDTPRSGPGRVSDRDLAR